MLLHNYIYFVGFRTIDNALIVVDKVIISYYEKVMKLIKNSVEMILI